MQLRQAAADDLTGSIRIVINVGYTDTALIELLFSPKASGPVLPAVEQRHAALLPLHQQLTA